MLCCFFVPDTQANKRRKVEMFWDAVNWIHQRICMDPFRFKRHPETIVKRDTGRLYVECLRCGHCSQGVFLRESSKRPAVQNGFTQLRLS